jgi:hypothetical protein
MIRRLSLLAFAGLCCLQQRTFAANGHWVGTWACGPQLTEVGNLPPIPLTNSTLRQFVHVTIGGQHLRVRFSNAYGGTNSFTIESAHVALAAGTALEMPIADTQLPGRIYEVVREPGCPVMTLVEMAPR